jgi:hypothetical protein
VRVKHRCTITLRSSEQFFWRESHPLLRSFVTQLKGIIESQGPQLLISCIQPMNGSMEHQSAGAFHDGLHGAFGNAVLVMGTDTTELEALSLLV